MPKIAVIAPLFLRIPPKKQGGTEWVVYHQCNGLVSRGYDVTLLAVAGTKTKAKLVPIMPKPVTEYPITLSGMEASRRLRLEMTSIGLIGARLMSGDYDLAFSHARGGETLLPLLHCLKLPVVTVLHLPVFAEYAELMKKFNAPLVSISNTQRKKFSRLNYVGTVYNCVDTDIFTFNPKPDDYLLMVTTIGEHKNTLDGILAARIARRRLIIAGKIRDQKYFKEKIKPHIDGKRVTYQGEIGLQEKIKLYRNAAALLFPVVWEEPFGLVMIEALSCGTPVLGYRSGAVPEVVTNGKTGFVTARSPAALAAAIKKIDRIDRAACRRDTERRFSIEKMIDGYERVIEKILDRR
ncbi:MAG: glycosyltransferase family 4 protein [Patescibacteria group bacterium]|nr:glycosyltransferase family 4 protein [Patescibacteria group bacterium]